MADVTVYTKNRCQPCKATTRKLTELGIAFDTINVDEDPAARDLLVAEGWRESPVVKTASGRAWSGYHPGELASLESAA